ncbi:MAG: amidohydrolase, partial [Rhodospirillales bacterium]|nr:amidohydrolase [Rhodospirillales bacterium]
ASALDFLMKPELVETAWDSFRDELAGAEYRPLLPVGQDPPADLNRAMMETFRPQMREHYLKEKPEFV